MAAEISTSYLKEHSAHISREQTRPHKGEKSYQTNFNSTSLSKNSMQNLDRLRTSKQSSLLIDSNGSGMRQVEKHFGGDLLKIQQTIENLPDEIYYAMRMGFPILIDIECFADRHDLLLWLLEREQYIYEKGRFYHCFISLDGLEWGYDPMFQVFLYSSYSGSETLDSLKQEVLQHLNLIDCLQEFCTIEHSKCQVLPLQVIQASPLDELGMISVSCFNLSGECKCQLSVEPWNTKVYDLRGLIARHLAWLCHAVVLVFPENTEIVSLDVKIGELLCSQER